MRRTTRRRTAVSVHPDTVKITVLADNRAVDGLESEHGLSLWIEAGDRRILFDTGQTTVALDNARKLGIELDQPDFLVLSHGHYDHTGGVHEIIGRSGAVQAYCHPAVTLPRYSKRDDRFKSVGMPMAPLRALEVVPPERLHWVTSSCTLFPGAGLTGPIPRLVDFENAGGRHFLDRTGIQPDPFDDDMALWLNTGQGLVVCVGCCHAGLTNTLNQALRCSHAARIHAVIGGFHLWESSGQRLQQTLGALMELNPDMIIPCHCTGERFMESLRLSLGDRSSPGRAGAKYRFGNEAGPCISEPSVHEAD